MTGKNGNKIVNYLRNIKARRTSLRLQNKKSVLNNTTPCPPAHPLGLFNGIPEEVLCYIFQRIPLYELSTLCLASRAFRDKILTYHYSNHALCVLKPVIQPTSDNKNNSKGKNNEPTAQYIHFHNLGIFMKRLTCLFSTRERLRIVGVLLEKLTDTHFAMCENFGSNPAYRCYGHMLHAFIAGWENDEKVKAFTAIKSASRVDERLLRVLDKDPGSMPWYEKYVRVFYREIFLDKADDDVELAFWLNQMLSPVPIFFQARLLYILFGPADEDEELLAWEQMTTCPTFFGVKNDDLEGLAKALICLHKCNVTGWNSYNLVSVLEELIALPNGWCLENIAKLLKMCGYDICCEFLGSKAVNGRIQELAYIAYYIVQAWMENRDREIKPALEWFVKLLKQVLKCFSCDKQKQMFVASLFDVWEETIVGLNEDIMASPDNDLNLLEIYTASVHSLTKVTGMLLLESSHS